MKNGRGSRLSGANGPPLSPLTKHDERLLELISHGVSDEHIGEQLHLSADAVRANVRKVVQANVRKVVTAMGARNRTHAVALALKIGLIE